MVRTTISFDPRLHQNLSVQAVRMGMSLSKLVNLKLTNKHTGQDIQSVQTRLASDLAFFQKLAKKAGKTDWAKQVRKERDRDRG